MRRKITQTVAQRKMLKVDKTYLIFNINVLFLVVIGFIFKAIVFIFFHVRHFTN